MLVLPDDVFFLRSYVRDMCECACIHTNIKDDLKQWYYYSLKMEQFKSLGTFWNVFEMHIVQQ